MPEYMPGLLDTTEEVEVFDFTPKQRPKVRTNIWRTLWYVLRGMRVYVR
jgi:hypothetical protein